MTGEPGKKAMKSLLSSSIASAYEKKAQNHAIRICRRLRISIDSMVQTSNKALSHPIRERQPGQAILTPIRSFLIRCNYPMQVRRRTIDKRSLQNELQCFLEPESEPVLV